MPASTDSVVYLRGIHASQADLEIQRLALQARLKEALSLPVMPATSITTTSPVDKVVAMLDGLLQVRSHSSAHTQVGCITSAARLQPRVAQLIGLHVQ